MKLIEPKVELWEQGNTLTEIWEHITKCTRVCYQSEPKNTYETGEQFVKRIILRNHSYEEIAKNRELQEKLHLSVLEHGTVYLAIDIACDVSNYSNAIKYIKNKYSRIFEKVYGGTYCTNQATCYSTVFITTNMRVLIENGWMDDLKYLCKPTEYHTLRKTFSIWTNTGAIRDTNRHRVHSISEESSRYCKYSSSKFGSELSIAKMPWISDKDYAKAMFSTEDLFNKGVIPAHDTNTWSANDWYLWYLQMGEIAYNKLSELGWKAQQCSEVLTFSTKTQSVHTAFIDDWQHYCHLRSDEVSGKVRPEVKIIADKINKIING